MTPLLHRKLTEMCGTQKLSWMEIHIQIFDQVRGSTHDGLNIQSPLKLGDKVIAKDCVFKLNVC